MLLIHFVYRHTKLCALIRYEVCESLVKYNNSDIFYQLYVTIMCENFQKTQHNRETILVCSHIWYFDIPEYESDTQFL